MLETGGVLVFVLGAMAIAALVATVDPMLLLWASAAVALSGLLAGVPAGAVYHVRLRASLLESGPLPDDFYVRPHAYHDALDPTSQRRILPAFYVGAFGFGLFLLGSAAAVIVLATHFF